MPHKLKTLLEVISVAIGCFFIGIFIFIIIGEILSIENIEDTLFFEPIIYLFPVSVILFLEIIYRKNSFSDIGIKSEKILKYAAIGFLIAIFIFFFIDLTTTLIEIELYPETMEEDEEEPLIVLGFSPPSDVNLISALKWILIIAAESFLIIAPAEELIFRGYMQRRLQNTFGLKSGLVLASILFGVIHYDTWLTFLDAALAGMIFGYLYQRTGSLMPSIFAHGFGNVILYSLVLLP